MKHVICRIELYSDWHCGAGISSGADLDLLTVKDRNGLPYIPGKTLKGLLKDAASALADCGACTPQFIEAVFGKEAVDKEQVRAEHSKSGACVFSDATLSERAQKGIVDGNGAKLLFRKIASTAIDDNGQAKDHSLRKTETAVPMTLFAEIRNIPDGCEEQLEKSMKYIKRLGSGRNRGLGRCDITMLKGGAQ